MKEKNKKIIFVIIFVMLLLIIAITLLNKFDSDRISKVKRLLSERYDSIECIDLNCNEIMSINIKGNKSNIKLYDENANVVANYSEITNDRENKVPIALSKNYFLATSNDSNNNIIYTINDKNGKQLYKTKNRLKSINDYFTVMIEEGKVGNIYTIIDSKGNKKYSNINEYQSYLDGDYIYLEKNSDCFLLDKKGNKIIENYKIVDAITDDNKNVLYFVMKDIKSDNYYYFNIKKRTLIGDGFNSYKVNKDNTLTVVKKETKEYISYKIDTNGKKIKSSISYKLSDRIKEIKDSINSDDYYLYTLSVISNKQTKVLVDNKNQKSFGIFDIKTKKYISLYSYDSDTYYSSISVLDSLDDDKYVQISCNSNACKNTKMIVFNLTDSKELFRIDGTDLVAQNYIQYENGYKIVKYSYKSNNLDYKGKYVLYDNKNNELLTNNNQISVIDSKYVIGNMPDESLLLYSSKDNKSINDDENLANKIKISNNVYYTYKMGDSSIVINSKGKKIYSSKNNKLEYGDENIYSIGAKTIKIYNIDKEITKTYRLLKNESLNDALDNKLEVFMGAIFINNEEDNYFKVINSKAKVIKKANNVSINKVIFNKKNNRAYIVSQKKVNGKTKYGLYIAR